VTELADALFVDPAMARIWSAEQSVRCMLAFEAALAHAEAQAGILPLAAAEAISAACEQDHFDAPSLFREAAISGTPVIPLIRMLEDRVAGGASGYVHYGATSQDVLDTALALQMREGIDLLVGRTFALAATCAKLAEQHRQTLMVGRTLLQQAAPITFGLKAARWLSLALRQTRRLRELREGISVVQFGGATGTLAALGGAGPQVTELLATQLGLAVPDLPWHAERDRVAAVATGLGIVAAAAAKIAQDIVLLAQTEIGEVSEARAEGKGVSSALPQKRNPVDAIAVRAAAQLAIGSVPAALGAMIQEHERAAGAWQAEWALLPDLFRFTSGALNRLVAAVEGLEIHPDRMRDNLEHFGGLALSEALAMALTPGMGRHEAQRAAREIANRAAATGVNLREAAMHDKRVRRALPPNAIDQIFDPVNYLGSTDLYIDRALEDFRTLRSKMVTL
jgi:3-carboxy-cis,cis-muconate cycloisomerase